MSSRFCDICGEPFDTAHATYANTSAYACQITLQRAILEELRTLKIQVEALRTDVTRCREEMAGVERVSVPTVFIERAE